MRTLRLSLTGTVILVLLGALTPAGGATGEAPAAVAIRATDAAGDAAAGTPDVVTVSARTTAEDELILDVELAGDWDLSEMGLDIVLFTDPQVRADPRVTGANRTELPVPYPGYCNAWFMDSVFIQVSEQPEFLAETGLSGAWITGGGGPTEMPAWMTFDQALEYAVAGPILTVAVPLAVLGDPETLSLSVRTQGRDGDRFPDADESCYLVPLVASGSPGGAEASPGQAISTQVMEVWASGDEAAIEEIYDPGVVMLLDQDQLAGDRDEITSVIQGAIGFGNTYHQVGPVIEYEDSGGDLYVGTIVEVRGPGHPTGVPVVGFYRVRDGRVIRHVFMDAEHY